MSNKHVLAVTSLPWALLAAADWTKAKAAREGRRRRRRQAVHPALVATKIRVTIPSVPVAPVKTAVAALGELADLRVLPQRLEDDIEKAKPARPELAAAACRLRRCVKKQYDCGRVVGVENFPLRRARYAELGHYGCSVAVEMLLEFQTECLLLFVAMFVLALPALADNWQRNAERESCREALASFVSNVSAVGVAVASTEQRLLECGYTSVSTRQTALPPRPGYLRATLGTCEEFSNATALTLPSVDAPYPFVPVPDAPFCIGATASSYALQQAAAWSAMLGGLAFLVFLLRVRRMQTSTVRDFDARSNGPTVELGPLCDSQPLCQSP